MFTIPSVTFYGEHFQSTRGVFSAGEKMKHKKRKIVDVRPEGGYLLPSGGRKYPPSGRREPV
ncbi:hypothetical protein ccbrp13_32750 [Ktedonobacteria bacterium brp13]|nr:hypothetical protein ccbrp13_32750 [Ktedonobacteria bacterium brp13]